jgi:hypothetical protein
MIHVVLLWTIICRVLYMCVILNGECTLRYFDMHDVNIGNIING